MNAQAQQLIDYISQSGKPLNPWEEGFIQSIKGQDRTSQKQINVLCSIYSRVWGGGQYAQKQYV